MDKLKSFSQMQQDLIAYKFFAIYPPKSGFFIDVGAFDGVKYSNTRLFYQKGWGGICFEPVEKNYRKLEECYVNTNVITVKAAITDFTGTLDLNVATIPWSPDWGSDVSSASDDVVKKWDRYQWEKETVPAFTLNSALEKYGINVVDYVSIDVEGQEVAVLRGFDLHKYHPALVIVEYSSQEEEMELRMLMSANGYFLWQDNGQDLFFVFGSLFKRWKLIPEILWRKILRAKRSLF